MNVVDQVELARHLGISDRRVRQLEAEKIVERLPDEPTRYDLDASARRYRLYAGGDMDAVCRQIEEASTRIDNMFSRMRAEDDIQRRREIVASEGGAIGQLDAAMSIANALAPQHSCDLLKTFKYMCVGSAIGECFALCNWRLANEASVEIDVSDFPAPFAASGSMASRSFEYARYTSLRATRPVRNNGKPFSRARVLLASPGQGRRGRKKFALKVVESCPFRVRREIVQFRPGQQGR